MNLETVFFAILIVTAIVLYIVRNGRAVKVASSEKVLLAQTRLQEELINIQSGNFKSFIPIGVMVEPDEKFFWQQSAQYGQTQKGHQTRGASPALYIPLGHGVRMRAGGWQGSSNAVSHFVWGPFGQVFVSNLRVLFKSIDGNAIAQAPFHEIITYDAFPDGLALHTKGVGAMQFKTGDSRLGAMFLQMVNPPQAATSSEKALP